MIFFKVFSGSVRLSLDMKKSVLALVLLALTVLPAFAQTGSPEPLYKQFPGLPPISILKTDSSTLFTQKDLKKNCQTLLIIFSPECDHCKKETEELLASIDKFKKIQIVMATPMPFDKMKEFYEHYKLAGYSNITVGQDSKFLLPTFYKVRMLPFMAFYDKKGTIIDVKEGNLPIDQVLKKFE